LPLFMPRISFSPHNSLQSLADGVDPDIAYDPVFWGCAQECWDKPPLININVRVETVATSRMFKLL